MKTDYLKIKFLENDDILKIKKFLDVSIESDWNDGGETYLGDPNTKNNKELENKFIKENISKIIFDSINKNTLFFHFCFPKKIDNILITKTSSGGFYNTHTDTGFNGNFSTTIFLSEPNTYQGGELCLYMNGEETKIKLNAGYGICYPTGIPHRVNKVTSGERHVAVFWTRSFIKDSFIREICYELSQFNFDKPSKNLIETHEEFEKVLDQNAFKINEIYHKLIRRYADL
jgi:PKHD-type hydroxylase